MNAILLLSSRTTPPRKGDLPVSFAAPADDGRLLETGAIFGPEEPLFVSFVGLTAEEARKAVASFPGARRCLLAGD